MGFRVYFVANYEVELNKKNRSWPPEVLTKKYLHNSLFDFDYFFNKLAKLMIRHRIDSSITKISLRNILMDMTVVDS